METLHVLTYNIHKGFPQFNRRVSLHDLRERLQSVEPDLVFLQEVVGFHARFAERHRDWPTTPQYEYLADSVWHDFAAHRVLVSLGHTEWLDCGDGGTDSARPCDHSLAVRAASFLFLFSAP